MTSHAHPNAAADLTVPRPKVRREVTHRCEYQVVWTTKFARPVLRDYQDELRQLLIQTAQDMRVEIVQLVLTDDVVSATLRVDPTQGVHRAVTQLKLVSASVLRRNHASLRSRVPSLWNKKYLVESLGSGADAQRVRDFLEQQRRG